MATRRLSKHRLNFSLTGKQRSPVQQRNSQRMAALTIALARARKQAEQQAQVNLTSWWLDLDRTTLNQRAHQEALRMSASKFAQSFGVD